MSRGALSNSPGALDESGTGASGTFVVTDAGEAGTRLSAFAGLVVTGPRGLVALPLFAVFLAGAFFATALFGAVFLAGAFFATAFFAVVFLATCFAAFFVVFLAAVFFRAAFADFFVAFFDATFRDPLFFLEDLTAPFRAPRAFLLTFFAAISGAFLSYYLVLISQTLTKLFRHVHEHLRG